MNVPLFIYIIDIMTLLVQAEINIFVITLFLLDFSVTDHFI